MVIGDPTLGDAILDRLVHNAYQLNLGRWYCGGTCRCSMVGEPQWRKGR